MSLGNVIIQGLTAEAFETGFAAHVIEGRTFYTYLENAWCRARLKQFERF